LADLYLWGTQCYDYIIILSNRQLLVSMTVVRILWARWWRCGETINSGRGRDWM